MLIYPQAFKHGAGSKRYIEARLGYSERDNVCQGRVWVMPYAYTSLIIYYIIGVR